MRDETEKEFVLLRIPRQRFVLILLPSRISVFSLNLNARWAKIDK
jgi:hypothetical protein